MKAMYVCEHAVLTDGNKYYHPFLSEVLERYDKLSSKITIFCVLVNADLSGFDSSDLIVKGEYKFIGVRKLNRLKSLLVDLAYNKSLVKSNIKKFDLLIAKQPSFLGSIAIHYAKKYKIPNLVEVVGCGFDSFWNHSFRGKIISPLTYLLMRRSVKSSMFAIYVTKSFLQSRYPTNGKSINCSDVIIPPPPQEGKLFKHLNDSLHRCRINLLTIGAVNVKYKNQSIVIEAVSKLKEQGYDIHYYLVGGGSSARLEEFSSQMNIKSNIHFLGTLGHTDIFNLLDKTDIYIQPSKVEGLPRALIEALSKGCPAIGTNIGGIPELLHAKYLFNPKKVDELISIIQRLDLEELKSMSNTNLLVSAKYSRDVLLIKRVSFYNAIKDYIINVSQNKY